jgi:hypothetical protein
VALEADGILIRGERLAAAFGIFASTAGHRSSIFYRDNWYWNGWLGFGSGCHKWGNSVLPSTTSNLEKALSYLRFLFLNG